MKKTFAYCLTGLAFSILSLTVPMQGFDIPEESTLNFSLPESFTMQMIDNNSTTFIFKTRDIIFAQVKFNKKFSLKTPYGKTITTARIYELVPNNRPLLVVQNSEKDVIGYVRLENYQRGKLFQPLTGIVYDSNGSHVLTAKFPLTSKYCKIYAVDDQGQLSYLASTKGDEGNSILATLSSSTQDLHIDPLLLSSVLHIHASKSLLIKISSFNAIDEIDLNGLGDFSHSDFIEKSLPTGQSEQFDVEQEQLRAILAQVEGFRKHSLTAEEQENSFESLVEQFGTEGVSLQQVEEAIPSLGESEKATLFSIIESRLDALSA